VPYGTTLGILAKGSIVYDKKMPGTKVAGKHKITLVDV